MKKVGQSSYHLVLFECCFAVGNSHLTVFVAMINKNNKVGRFVVQA
ncbi:hypothetical protein O59_002389 [Cellvibrio sp. BR]|nr:hypothetical protein O59_002389 [Cellvibrio sp. BR]